jgi:DNA-directed RNA polymerase subunit RPC12/RpoP
MASLCLRCGEQTLGKSRDGYVYCSNCGYEEYDGCGEDDG